MTTNDIQDAQIILRMKDGTACVGLTNDIIVFQVLAQFVKFCQIDENKLLAINIKDIIKK